MNWTIILLVVCFAGIIVGFNLFIHRMDFIRSSEIGQGEVISMNPKRTSKGGTVYSPEIAFKTKDGKNGCYISKMSSSTPGLHTG